MSMETEICEILDNHPLIGPLVGDRIMAMDFRADDWKNAVNYLGVPVQVLHPHGYIQYSVVVDRTGLRRGLILRGAGKFMDTVDIWIYGPRGVVGYNNAVAMMMAIQEFNQDSLPNRQMMMLAGTIGPLDDGSNLMTNVSFQLTRVLEDNHV